MSKLMFPVFAIVLTTALLSNTSAIDHEKGTWTGEVLDLVCYVTKGATGASNRECGHTSVKTGQPMGLLTDDGTLVLLAAEHKNLAQYKRLRARVGERTQVMGALAERDGMKVVLVTAWKGD